MIFCTPKKDSAGFYTKLRIIRNGSYHEKGFDPINKHIDPLKCKMRDLPNILTYARLFATKNWFCCFDLSDFFRQICLQRSDWDNVCYSVFGLNFHDCKQPYEVASDPANSQYFATIIVWILNSCIIPKDRVDLLNSILVHIDDFVLATENKADCLFLENEFIDLLYELNVQISEKKTIHTTQTTIIHGLHWNLNKKSVSIPDDKYTEIVRFINLIIKYRVITGRALESITGKIMHWSQLNKCTKALVYNSIAHIHNNIRNGKIRKNQLIILPLSIINDLKYWLYFAKYLKNVPLTHILNNPTINIYAATDACEQGAGFVVSNKFSHYKFRKSELGLPIHLLEAHCVLTFIESNKQLLSGKCVHLYIDNQSCFYAMVRKWSPAFTLMVYIYELCLLLLKYRIFMRFEWVPTEFNTLPDLLSRNKITEFHNHAAIFNKIFTKITTNYYTKEQFIYKHNKIKHFQSDKAEYRRFAKWLTLPINQRNNTQYPLRF